MPMTAAGASTQSAISATLEDYLETILALVREGHVARSRDIASRLNVHKSTVTAALRSLGELGLIHYAPYEVITLTEEGEKKAQDVQRRHEALRKFFVEVLNVSEPVAEKAACAMEHVVPKEVLQRMADFSAFVRDCPYGQAPWLRQLPEPCAGRGDATACASCLQEGLHSLEASAEKEKDRKRESVRTSTRSAPKAAKGK